MLVLKINIISHLLTLLTPAPSFARATTGLAVRLRLSAGTGLLSGSVSTHRIVFSAASTSVATVLSGSATNASAANASLDAAVNIQVDNSTAAAAELSAAAVTVTFKAGEPRTMKVTADAVTYTAAALVLMQNVRVAAYDAGGNVAAALRPTRIGLSLRASSGADVTSRLLGGRNAYPLLADDALLPFYGLTLVSPPAGVYRLRACVLREEDAAPAHSNNNANSNNNNINASTSAGYNVSAVV